MLQPVTDVLVSVSVLVLVSMILSLTLVTNLLKRVGLLQAAAQIVPQDICDKRRNRKSFRVKVTIRALRGTIISNSQPTPTEMCVSYS